MIYAIIIIAALAAAFVILIRRLPEAANQSGQETRPAPKPAEPKIEPKTEKKGFGFTLPSLQMPKLHRTEANPKTERPAPTPMPTPAPTAPAPAAPPTAPAKFAFPSWSKKAGQAISPNSTAAPKDDFWEGIDEAVTKPAVQPQPVPKVEQPVSTPAPLPPKPAPMPTPTPTAPDPVPTPKPATTPLFSPFNKERPKPRPKDTFQEAEDLFAIKDYRKAEKLFLQLAANDPKNPKIYSRLGVIYMEQSNFEDARDALQQAIKLEPNIASRHFNLALAYANLGSKSKAVTSMEAALKYDPSNRKYRKMLDELLSSR
jgi:hypothetical protein